MEGLPLLGPRNASGSPARSPCGHHRQLARGAQPQPKRSVRAGARADAGGTDGEEEIRGVEVRGGGDGRERGGASCGGGGKAEAEAGISGVRDRDNIPLGDNRGDDGDVSEQVHHSASGGCPGLPPDIRRDGSRRLHCSGKFNPVDYFGKVKNRIAPVNIITL